MSTGESTNTATQDTLLHELCKGWGALMSRAKQSDFTTEASKQNDRGNLPLHAAASFKASPEVMDALIKSYPPGPSTSNLIGNLPLHHACMWKAPIECVEALLERHPAGVRHRNQYGSLPLHMAASNEAPADVIRVLIEAYPGALEDRNDDGMSPADLARAEGAGDVVSALLGGIPPPPELTRRQKADQHSARADELEGKLAALAAAQDRQRADLRLAVGAVLKIRDRFPSALHSVGVDPATLEKAEDVIATASDLAAGTDGSGPVSPPDGVDRFEALLSKMVGLHAVKAQVRGLRRSIELAGLADDGAAPVRAPHMVFVGNPGSGKSAVARMLSRALYDLGAVRKKSFVEVDRMDLVRRDANRTTQATANVLDDARGGVLFVDEAHALMNASLSRRGMADGASAAISEIVRTLPRGDPLIILAGFPVEMRKFLAEEGHLKARFPLLIEFPDYTCDEIAAIFIDMAATKGFELAHGMTVKDVAEAVEQETTVGWRGERNGRVAEQLLSGVRTQIRGRVREAAFDEEVDPHIIIHDDVLQVVREEFK